MAEGKALLCGRCKRLDVAVLATNPIFTGRSALSNPAGWKVCDNQKRTVDVYDRAHADNECVGCIK